MRTLVLTLRRIAGCARCRETSSCERWGGAYFACCSRGCCLPGLACSCLEVAACCCFCGRDCSCFGALACCCFSGLALDCRPGALASCCFSGLACSCLGALACFWRCSGLTCCSFCAGLAFSSCFSGFSWAAMAGVAIPSSKKSAVVLMILVVLMSCLHCYCLCACHWRNVERLLLPVLKGDSEDCKTLRNLAGWVIRRGYERGSGTIQIRSGARKRRQSPQRHSRWI